MRRTKGKGVRGATKFALSIHDCPPPTKAALIVDECDLLPRGVDAVPSPPQGYRVFRAVADDGTELLYLRVHRRANDRETCPDPVLVLRRWLDDADAVKPRLTLHRGGNHA